MKILIERIKSNYWLYILCLVSILICLGVLAYVSTEENNLNDKWAKFILDCDCKCISSGFEKYNISGIRGLVLNESSNRNNNT